MFQDRHALLPSETHRGSRLIPMPKSMASTLAGRRWATLTAVPKRSVSPRISVSRTPPRPTSPTGHFDLVVSMLVTHECPQPVICGLIKEAHRLPAPGGVTIHDGGAPNNADPFEHHRMSWFGNNANESFSAGYKSLDYDQALLDAGFTRENLFRGSREAVYLKGQLPPISFIGATKE